MTLYRRRVFFEKKEEEEEKKKKNLKKRSISKKTQKLNSKGPVVNCSGRMLFVCRVYNFLKSKEFKIFPLERCLSKLKTLSIFLYKNL